MKKIILTITMTIRKIMNLTRVLKIITATLTAVPLRNQLRFQATTALIIRIFSLMKIIFGTMLQVF